MKQFTTLKLLSFVTLSIATFPALTMDNKKQPDKTIQENSKTKNYLEESQSRILCSRYFKSTSYHGIDNPEKTNRHYIPKKECEHKMIAYEYLGHVSKPIVFATPNPYKKEIVKRHTDDPNNKKTTNTIVFYITDKEFNKPINWVTHIMVFGKKY